MIESFTYGSEIDSMVVGSGSSDGLSTSMTSPRRSPTRYSTVGAVVMSSSSNSRSSRSWTISRCSRPRKPHRNPKPRAAEFSGSNERAPSLSCSFSSASFRSPNWSESVGNSPANTIGFTRR